MEAWLGHKPSLRHLRVFGCEAYAHVPKEKQTKLDKKVVKCIFIRYIYVVKGYKIWNHVAQKVFYSRIVIFVETKLPSIIVQPEWIEEKKDVSQLLATPEKVELRSLERQVAEEISTIFESLEKEGEADHEPELEPDLV